MLHEAGWYPGRQATDLLVSSKRLLERDGGFILHEAAEKVLLEYGGLHIGEVGPGVDFAKSDLHLDPALAQGEEDRFYDYFPVLSNRKLFPLGEVHRGHAFLAIDSNGEVFELMEDIYGHWPSFRETMYALLLGRRA